MSRRYPPHSVHRPVFSVWCFSSAQWLKIAWSKGSTRLGASLPEGGSNSQFLKHVFYKIRWWTKSKKGSLCQWLTVLIYIFIYLCIYFILVWHYMLWTVCPSISRSSRLYIQQYLFDICLLLYVQSWTPDDGRKDHPKHVDCHSKIK